MFFVYHHYIQCDSIGVLGKKQKPFVLHHGKLFFFSFIYLFINYALYETTHFTVICMKWCEWKQENLYLQFCPYKASLTHTLMLNKLNDYNGVLHRTGTFYTHNFIHPFERTQYRACFFLTSCGMDPCCKCTWFRPCMVLCCIGSS